MIVATLNAQCYLDKGASWVKLSSMPMPRTIYIQSAVYDLTVYRTSLMDYSGTSHVVETVPPNNLYIGSYPDSPPCYIAGVLGTILGSQYRGDEVRKEALFLYLLFMLDLVYTS